MGRRSGGGLGRGRGGGGGGFGNEGIFIFADAASENSDGFAVGGLCVVFGYFEEVFGYAEFAWLVGC